MGQQNKQFCDWWTPAEAGAGSTSERLLQPVWAGLSALGRSVINIMEGKDNASILRGTDKIP